MVSKAEAAVVPVVVRGSGTPGRADSIVRSPVEPVHSSNPLPISTGRQRPGDFVTHAGDNNCAHVMRRTRTATAIVQPAA
jgi:hypothetical protein